MNELNETIFYHKISEAVELAVENFVQEEHQKIVCIVNKSQIGFLKDYKLAKKKGANHGFQILQIRNFHPGDTSSGSSENAPGSRCRTHRELRFLYVIK